MKKLAFPLFSLAIALTLFVLSFSKTLDEGMIKASAASPCFNTIEPYMYGYVHTYTSVACYNGDDVYQGMEQYHAYNPNQDCWWAVLCNNTNPLYGCYTITP